MRLKLKVCGMRIPSNIAEVVQLQPDYLGFIFYKQSKRYIDGLPVEVVRGLPEKIKKTGVFVDEGLDEVIEAIRIYNLDAVQLHGTECPAYCRKLMAQGVEVIKAFGVDEEFDFQVLSNYEEAVDYFLFDTKTLGHGGSGKTFSWSLLKKYTLATPYFLSGGIGLEELSEVVTSLNDGRLYGVDVNSRFETEPGLKDIEKLKAIRL